MQRTIVGRTNKKYELVIQLCYIICYIQKALFEKIGTLHHGGIQFQTLQYFISQQCNA